MARKKQQTQPFDLLREIEQQCVSNATGLPLQAESKKTTIAVAFRIGDVQLVAPMEQVKEILPYPSISRVPRTKTWMKGIANVRGMLLPVVDLQACLGAGKVNISKKSRVLVIGCQDALAGLVVDEVQGLRHFLDEEYSNMLPEIDVNLKQHLVGSYQQDNEQWGIFSMNKLADNPQFIQVAV